MALMNPARLGSKFDFQVLSFSLLVTIEQVLPANPRRWLLGIAATGNFGGVNGPLHLSLSADPSTNPFYTMSSRGQYDDFDFVKYGSFIQQAIYAENLLGTADFSIIEITLQPRGERLWVPQSNSEHSFPMQKQSVPG